MTPLIKDLYTATATATGGRGGRSTSNDGILDVALAAPVALGGPGGATNPEQLFAAGYAACFQSALGVVARRFKADITGSAVTADVTLGSVEGGAYGLKVALHAELPGLEVDVAQQLVDAAHQVCPYSNATRGNIEVTVSLATPVRVG
jgi:osmotically inducible protein OsmC